MKSNKPVVFITGAAKRVGAVVARHLHSQGFNLVLHYRHSAQEARDLQSELHAVRPDSVLLLQADLLQSKLLPSLVQKIIQHWGRLDALINNASSFYPTPVAKATEADWDDLLGSNLKAPFFLAQAAAPHLAKQQGCIINMVDIHGKQPLKKHPIYSIAKAGLIMMTRSLARELGADVRVNAIAPGAILWPENDMDELARQRIISSTALKRPGCPDDIARSIAFLLKDAPYITGQVIAVDGGRSLGYA
ncbi:pteridine reductase [Candidatus Venteria ishoeyi]|uniref:3-oxoacyl-[acyl-carrier-protein] reductase FabG n=1 Tax=Candidatus Venteria ishoeyi TaxID=1899563 RepID=A0A1H6FCV4_9GAMM|nr:pteridine reductase [Candidatus Venteria ishoeyi]SEH07887.1 3-oxoacyl-[acyl-carrier-protein] reductase FabG [Candidatus Venteria ishoeyi]